MNTGELNLMLEITLRWTDILFRGGGWGAGGREHKYPLGSIRATESGISSSDVDIWLEADLAKDLS